MRNNIAAELGKLFKENPAILEMQTFDTKFGALKPIRGPLNLTSQSYEYQNKRILFWLGHDKVVSYAWAESYVGDSTYFRRLYENTKAVYLDEQIPTPELLSFDDKNMVLVTNKLNRDLDDYLDSDEPAIVEKMIENIQDLFFQTWQKTKEKVVGFPRYVRFFLEPEYDRHKVDHVGEYLPVGAASLYLQVHKKLASYLKEMEKTGFESGFGLADIKIDNLVENTKGEVFFIDVDKPEKVH